MIRWYDYVLAILAADFILMFMLDGINATAWSQPQLYGLCAGLVWQLWKNDYCIVRLKQEMNK